MHRLGLLALVLTLALLNSPALGEHALLDDPSAGFAFTFEGFSQTPAVASVRLVDQADGWGGAGIDLPETDLTEYAGGRIVIDFQTGDGNRADALEIELYDAEGVSGKWRFLTSGAPVGDPQTLVSSETLGAPAAGVGAFQDLDLTRIVRWQVIGDHGSPAPFDVSISSVRLSNDADAPSPYPGHEPDAPWRAEAAERIDRHRKADLVVRVVDAGNGPVAGAKVTIRQQSHAFGFGSAVQAFRLRDDDPQHAEYKAKVAELFNLATIENNLKWPPWEETNDPRYTREGALAALDWLKSNHLRSRGHVLVWPGAENLPRDVADLIGQSPLNATQQQKLRERIATHLADTAGAVAGRVGWWDVVNEPRDNHAVMDALDEGNAAMAEWFKLARQADPDAKLFLNEYDILASAGGTDTASQRLLESQVHALLDAGAPINGVGLQGHFKPGNLTGPEQLWRIVDRYAAIGVDVQVTEFDLDTADERLQADYLRDFFTAMFAHPTVTGIVQWGFWEEAHHAPDAAMFRNDWSIKPNGQAYRDLVYGEWWTDAAPTLSAEGTAARRCCYGEHTVVATFGNHTVTATAVVDPDGAEVVLRLPMLLGDFNNNREVDTADWTVWRDSLGRSVDPPGDGPDINGDGEIDDADHALWKENYGRKLPPLEHE